MEIVISTRGVTKRFGSFNAVTDVSFEIQRGDIYGFLGLNGAGKTTTIRMLLGLIRPTTGSVYVLGEEIRSGGRGPWDRVGSLVETPTSYPELTVLENLDVLRRLRGLQNRKPVEEIVEKLNLTQYADRQVRHLSLGNVQRLGIAKALLHNPDILILDEPSNGLDPAGIAEVREILKDLAQNRSVTVFVSSHILDEVSRLATRVGIIHNGELVREVSASELSTLLRKRLLVGTRDNDRAVEVLLEHEVTDLRKEGEGIEIHDPLALEHPERIAEILVQQGVPPASLQLTQETLESFFLRTTAH